MVEQVVKDGVVMQGVAVAVETGVDVVFVAGGKPCLLYTSPSPRD